MSRISSLSLVLSGIVIFISLALSACQSNPTESDDEMRKNFESNQADFELLIEMAEVDRNVMRISPDFTWLENDPSYDPSNPGRGLSRERWDAYRELFAKLGLKKGLVRYSETGKVYLLTNWAGKGYVYSQSELFPLHDSLEGLDSKDVDGIRAYRKLSDNWYLYVEWDKR